jgi:predicted glycosyltransferase involved in capsule biosynthesis
MKIAVVIPWRETPSRLPLKEYVDAWYRSNLPEAKIIYSDSGHTPFNLAASRNAGAKQVLDYDVIVHNDADTIPDLECLLKGIEKTFKAGLFCNPYTNYYTINPDSTKKVLNGDVAIENSEYEQVHGACSGVIITTPKAWELVGGFDENFVNWGYEDVAIKTAHTVILDHDFLTIPGDVYAMSHEGADKSPQLLSVGLKRLEEYFKVSNNKELMLDLVKNNKGI